MRKLIALVILMAVVPAYAAVTVVVNGSNYTIPQTNEKGWGTNVTNWIQAISANTLQPTGGTFTLTNDLDLGASFGIKTAYVKSRSANIATAGLLRLASTESIGWRNNANTGNLLLNTNASDQLTFNGVPIIGSAGLTANRALVSDGTGAVSASAVTSTELGYVSGVTSAIQTQLGTKATLTGTESLTNKNVSLQNGTVSAPALNFVSDTGTGIYRVGLNDMSLVANGHTGLEIKDNGTYANVGLGSAPSASSNYIALLQRTNVSSGTYLQISNPDTSASSKATFQLAADNGNNNGEVSLFTSATTTDAYANSMTVRPSGLTGHLSLIGGDLSTGDVRFYVAGDYTSTGRALQVNADKSLQFMQEIATPTNPAASTVKLYAKTGDRLYHLNSAGTESKILAGQASLTSEVTGTLPIGNGGTGQTTATAAFNALHPMTTTGDMIYSSSGSTAARLPVGSSGQVLKSVGGVPTWASFSGGINYLNSNPDAEADTSGWTTAKNTVAASSPDSGFVAGTTTTWTRSTTSPLRGSGSFLLTKDAANRQGEHADFAFTIDSADKGQVLSIQGDYAVASGTYADGDLNVWVWDVTNGVAIQPAGYSILNTTVGQKIQATFQAASNSTSYKLLVFVASTSASAYTVKFDNWYVGPQLKSYGPITTDWTAYTPTLTSSGGGSITLNATSQVAPNAYWRRVGDSVEVVFGFTNGSGGAASGTAGTLQISLPSGLTTSSSLVSGGGGVQSSGNVTVYSGTSYAESSVNVPTGSTTVVVFKPGSSSAYQLSDIAASFGMTGFFSAKIAGWSSGQLLSSDADTRVVSLIANGSGTHTSTGGYQDIPTWTTAYDSHGAFSSGVYTIPSSGVYRFSGIVAFLSNATGNRSAQLIFTGSAAGSIELFATTPTSGVDSFTPFAIEKKLVAGDTVKLQGYQSSGGNLNYSASNTTLSISKISGPSQIAASESVNAHYNTTAGQSISNGATTTIVFGTKDYDSHSAMNSSTGVFTAPVSGKYRVSSQIVFASASFTAGNIVQLSLYKNGSLYSLLSRPNIDAASTSARWAGGADTVSLVAGDTIDVRVSHQESSARSLATTAGFNTIAIERVGN